MIQNIGRRNHTTQQ